MKTRKLWFKAKIYGWGWYPVTWQGWLITCIFVILILITPFSLEKQPFLFFLWFGVLILALILTCKINGEKPRWRWGK